MNKAKKKKLLITLSIVAAIVVVVIVIVLLSIPRKNAFEYDGWIDCQPILSKEEADLCKRAEEAGYPYIAY